MKKLVAMFLCLSLIPCMMTSMAGENDGIGIKYASPASEGLEENIVQRDTYELCLKKDYSNLEDLLNNTDMVVYAETTGIEYFHGKGGAAWTKETVNVIDPMSSSLKAGSTITVVEQVGVISIYDYVNSMSDNLKEFTREYYKAYSDDELKEMYVEQSDGTPLPKKGDIRVLCLLESYWSEGGDTVYEPVGAYMGKFIKIGNDAHVRKFPTFDAATRSVNVTESKQYTLAELKNLLAK